MAAIGFIKRQRKLKKTRQGAGRGTKWGTKGSKKHYVKDRSQIAQIGRASCRERV